MTISESTKEGIHRSRICLLDTFRLVEAINHLPTVHRSATTSICTQRLAIISKQPQFYLVFHFQTVCSTLCSLVKCQDNAVSNAWRNEVVGAVSPSPTTQVKCKFSYRKKHLRYGILSCLLRKKLSFNLLLG